MCVCVNEREREREERARSCLISQVAENYIFLVVTSLPGDFVLPFSSDVVYGTPQHGRHPRLVSALLLVVYYAEILIDAFLDVRSMQC